MKIIDRLNEDRINISFEVFPPKTDAGFANVQRATDEIAKLDPSYISVTYGAGGGTSKNTAKIASHIKDDLHVLSLAHLTCASTTKEEVREVILFHEAYAYVAEDYGLQVNYLLDLDEERQVSAGEVSDVLSAVRKGHVKYILAEELYGKSMGDTIRKESDAKVLYLDPLNRGTYEKDSYINGMKKNMEILEEAFYAKDH